MPVKDRMWTKKPLGVGRDEDRGGDETSKERLSKTMEGATRGRMDCMHNRVVKERGNKARVKNRSSSPSKFGAMGRRRRGEKMSKGRGPVHASKMKGEKMKAQTEATDSRMNFNR